MTHGKPSCVSAAPLLLSTGQARCPCCDLGIRGIGTQTLPEPSRAPTYLHILSETDCGLSALSACHQIWPDQSRLLSRGNPAATHGGSSLPPILFENTFSISPSQRAFECFKARLLVFEMHFRSVISMVCPVLIAGCDR